MTYRSWGHAWWFSDVEGHEKAELDLDTVACFAAIELMRRGNIGVGAFRALVDFLDQESVDLTATDPSLVIIFCKTASAVDPEALQSDSIKTFSDFFRRRFVAPMKEIGEKMAEQDVSRLNEAKKFCLELSQVLMTERVMRRQDDGHRDRRRLVS